MAILPSPLTEATSSGLKQLEAPLHHQLAELLESHSDRPSWDEYFMAVAILIASRSACQRLRVGCVLVSQGEHPNRIIAAGYNGFLPGHPHLSRIQNKHELATVHAEQNAIADAARRGVSLQNATAYITHFPCLHCTKILLAAGITHFKYHQDYNNEPIASEIIQESKAQLTQL